MESSHPAHRAYTNLTDLPLEVLLMIYSYAQSPQLSHVCRKLWVVLPSFMAQSLLLGQLAFDSQAMELLSLKRSKSSKMAGRPFNSARNYCRKALMQASQCQTWMTVAILRKVRNRVVQRSIELILRSHGMDFHPSTQKALDELLDSIESCSVGTEFGCTVESFYGLQERFSKIFDHLPPEKSLKLFIAANQSLELSVRSQSKTLRIQPFYPIYSNVHQLFPRVADFDKRVQQLVDEFALLRISPRHWQSPEPTEEDIAFSPLHESIRTLLDSERYNDTEEQSQVQSKEFRIECLKTLLRHDVPVITLMPLWKSAPQFFTLPAPIIYYIPLAKRPVYVNSVHYRYVMYTGNVAAFKLLLTQNPVLFNPNATQLIELLEQEFNHFQARNLRPQTRTTLELARLVDEAANQGQPEWKEMLHIIYRSAAQSAMNLKQFIIPGVSYATFDSAAPMLKPTMITCCARRST